jgi:hypothetical protein
LLQVALLLLLQAQCFLARQRPIGGGRRQRAQAEQGNDQSIATTEWLG